MSEHDDRHDHDAKAEELEFELAEMQERTDSLEDKIEGTGEKWESRKADESVPGAVGEPAERDDDGDEADDGGDEELDFGRDIEAEEVVGEKASSDDENESNDEDSEDSDDGDDAGDDDADEDEDSDDAEEEKD